MTTPGTWFSSALCIGVALAILAAPTHAQGQEVEITYAEHALHPAGIDLINNQGRRSLNLIFRAVDRFTVNLRYFIDEEWDAIVIDTEEQIQTDLANRLASWNLQCTTCRDTINAVTGDIDQWVDGPEATHRFVEGYIEALLRDIQAVQTLGIAYVNHLQLVGRVALLRNYQEDAEIMVETILNLWQQLNDQAYELQQIDGAPGSVDEAQRALGIARSFQISRTLTTRFSESALAFAEESPFAEVSNQPGLQALTQASGITYLTGFSDLLDNLGNWLVDRAVDVTVSMTEWQTVWSRLDLVDSTYTYAVGITDRQLRDWDRTFQAYIRDHR